MHCDLVVTLWTIANYVLDINHPFTHVSDPGNELEMEMTVIETNKQRIQQVPSIFNVDENTLDEAMPKVCTYVYVGYVIGLIYPRSATSCDAKLIRAHLHDVTSRIRFLPWRMYSSNCV